MVERNAPCPCGSGKKYKKCCALKESGIQKEIVEKEIVETELNHVIFSYPEGLFKDREHLKQMEKVVGQWRRKLNAFISDDQAETLAFDYYLFVTARDQWNRHILKMMNGTIRSTTRSMLKLWSRPIMLIGKVVGERGNYFEIEEVLGHHTYLIEQDEIQNVKLNDIIIAIAFEDTREIEQGLYFFNEVIGIRDGDGEIMQDIKELAKSSGAANLTAFFDQHMLDVYTLIFNREVPSVQQFIDHELTVIQQSVCDILAEQLERHEAMPMQIELSQMIAMSYFQQENPTFRKPAIIAAAVFKAMENYGLIEFAFYYSQREVAELFDVSVASMAKHIEPIEMILEFMMEELGEEAFQEEPTATYYIGTDPLMTERANWEMACRIEVFNSDSMEDLQLFINEKMNEQFIPKGKVQKAQAYAYDAYEQDDEARNRLGTAAYLMDSNNVDAILLKAEQAKTLQDAQRHYERAIAIGEEAFDSDFENSPWDLVKNRPFMRALFIYGVLLFEEEQFEESLSYFKRLLDMNPNDNQGARHLAIAAAIHSEQYVVATRLFQKFPSNLMDPAVYSYLQWLFDVKQDKESDVLSEAVALNSEVAELIRSDIPRIPYPTKMSVVPGSMEEAFYISILLWPNGERSL